MTKMLSGTFAFSPARRVEVTSIIVFKAGIICWVAAKFAGSLARLQASFHNFAEITRDKLSAFKTPFTSAPAS